MLKISFSGCVGLSSVISMQFSLKMCDAISNRRKNLLKPYFGVQGHRCWYPRKARQQCLLWYAGSLCPSATILFLDWTTVAETARFEGGTQIWCTRMEDSLNLGGRTFHTQVVMVYLECFRRNSLLKCVSRPKIAKNSLKTLFVGFKVVHLQLVPLESSSAVLVMISSKSVYLQPFSR